MDLCLNASPFELVHKSCALDPNLVEIKEEDVKMEVTIAITSLKRNLNSLDTTKGPVIPANDFTPALAKYFEFS